MPNLTNPRHEKFALALREGKSATEAYTLAGYKPCRQNAARLMTNDDVKQRLVEIQAAAAKKSEVTVASLLDELEHARARADGLDQLSAAVKAISEKAKISGLLVQKVEVGGPGDFDGCETPEQVVEQVVREIVVEAPNAKFSPEDKAELLALFTQINEIIAAAKAQPVHAAGYGYSQRREELERPSQRRLTQR